MESSTAASDSPDGMYLGSLSYDIYSYDIRSIARKSRIVIASLHHTSDELCPLQSPSPRVQSLVQYSVLSMVSIDIARRDHV